MYYCIGYLVASVVTAYILGRFSTLPDEPNGMVIVIPASIFWPFTAVIGAILGAYTVALDARDKE